MRFVQSQKMTFTGHFGPELDIFNRFFERKQQVASRVGVSKSNFLKTERAFNMSSKMDTKQNLGGVLLRSTAGLRKGRCKRCGAPMLWAKSSLGNWIPMDVRPSQAGTHVLYKGRDVPIARLDGGEDPEAPRFECHRETCRPKTEAQLEQDRNEQKFERLQRQMKRDRG